MSKRQPITLDRDAFVRFIQELLDSGEHWLANRLVVDAGFVRGDQWGFRSADHLISASLRERMESELGLRAPALASPTLHPGD